MQYRAANNKLHSKETNKYRDHGEGEDDVVRTVMRNWFRDGTYGDGDNKIAFTSVIYDEVRRRGRGTGRNGGPRVHLLVHVKSLSQIAPSPPSPSAPHTIITHTNTHTKF